MRKIFVGFLSVVCLICLSLAAACKEKAPEYFTLIYAEQAGITYDFGDIKSGAEVKKGYDVTFTVAFDEKLEGTPVVTANETELKAGADGVYSFKMTADTSVTVIGVYMPDNYTVIFDSGDPDDESAEYRIHYYDKDGKDVTDEEASYRGGEKVSFTLDVSVYYSGSDYRVTANTTVLQPDENGVYSFDVYAPTRITVRNLKLDDGFANREDGGKGTKDDPFRIERPIDLYYMADLVSNSWYGGAYAVSYYRLEADIDLKGEQLFVIGDLPTDDSISMFCGDFDGNGHKISNYVIKDSIIEQSGFTEVPLRYIGMFGYVSALASRDVNIYDLTLEDFTIDIDGKKHSNFKTGFYAGGLVGYGTGVNITNCKVNGSIIAEGNNDYPSHIGGIIGWQQAAYSADVTYYSGVVGCQSNVDIECTLGYVYTAGGITGYMSAGSKTANAYVLNSYATGNVTGAVNAGGVVGYMGPYSSIVNSYAAGEDVFARNNNTSINGHYDYSYAYAGGIAGYASYGTVIADSFSATSGANISAEAASGASYAFKGGIIGGHSAAGEPYVNCEPFVTVNSYSAGSGVTFNQNFYKNTLKWSEHDWNFEGAYPEATVNKSVPVSFEITVKYDGNAQTQFNGSSYAVLSYWYEEGFAEYLTSGNNRSYGYFFDAEKTQPVPNSYIPTHAVELYVDYANYNDVTGTYYLRTGNGDEAYIRLDADGTFTYRYGAISYKNIYVYDGTTVTLTESPVFTDTVTNNGQSADYYICAKATLTADGLSFYDGVNYQQQSPLTAVKELNGFTYGGYYADGADDYTFYKDGTGLYGNRAFTYTVSGNTVSISLNGVTGTVSGNSITIGGVVYTAYDEFRGTWEKSATAHKQYTFDGKGNWSYGYFYYDGEGNVQNIDETASGTYVREGDCIKLDDGTTVGYDAVNKCITIADVPFYKENSLTGEWKFLQVKQAVTVSFYGVGGDGYGKATINYGSGALVLENVDYEIIENGGETHVILAIGDEIYGDLIYSAAANTLTGTIQHLTLNKVLNNALFCLFDDFKGLWLSDIGTVEFNGLGKYNLKGTSVYTRTEGSVSVNGYKVGSYTVDGTMISGSFTYDGETYEIYYNDATGMIDVTTSGNGKLTFVTVDELYGIALVAEDGTKYTFNGGGKLENGGKLTVVKQEQTAEYTYKVSGGAVDITDYGTLINDNGVYKLTVNEETSVLSIDNPFTGSWEKGGVNYGGSGHLQIDTINADRKASGSYLGTDVQFIYNMEEGYLSFGYDGATLYIFAFKDLKHTELAVSAVPDTLNGFDACMKADERDAYVGTYTRGDDYVKLDGLSTSSYSKGTAVVKNGEKESVYVYVINSLGEIELKGTNGEKTSVFVQSGAEGAYAGSGKSYALIEVDYFYLRSTTDAAGIVYRFDGHGTVSVSNGTVFEYVIGSYDEVKYEYTLTFKAGDKEYTAIYDRSASDYKLTLTPDYMKGLTATDAEGKTYAFDGAGKATASDNKTYEYKIVGYDKENDAYELLLISKDENSVEYDAVYSRDNGNITVTLKDVFEGVEAVSADGNVYKFDGKGKVTDSDKESYSYTIVGYDKDKDEYKLLLVSKADGTGYDARYNRADGGITVVQKASEGNS